MAIQRRQKQKTRTLQKAAIRAINLPGLTIEEIVRQEVRLALATRFVPQSTESMFKTESVDATIAPTPILREPSGSQWCARFPTSVSVDELITPFRTNVGRFIAALKAANINVSIAATYRPEERAYLMHWAWRIGRELVDPRLAGTHPNVPIDWVHRTAQGTPDLVASKRAAQDMVSTYGMVQIAALHSRHTQRLAIDMTLSWAGTVTIQDGAGTAHSLATPRDGSNTTLHKVGASYDVIKLVSDPPHWSSDGH